MWGTRTQLVLLRALDLLAWICARQIESGLSIDLLVSGGPSFLLITNFLLFSGKLPMHERRPTNEDYTPTMLKAVIGGKAARKETEEQASVQLHSCAKKS